MYPTKTVIRVRTIYLIILLILFNNCGREQPHAVSEVFERFDSSFVDHFPKNGRRPFYRVEFFPGKELSALGFLATGAFVTCLYQYDSDEIADLIVSYGLNDLQSIEHGKCDCFFICHYSLINKVYKSGCSTGNLPIPSFFSTRERLGIQEEFLSSDFLVYVLDAQAGEYLPPELLSKATCDKWAHGYSKGVVINEDRGMVGFWIEIW